LGVLLVIGGFGYLIDVFGSFLSSSYNLSIGLLTGLAEIVFLLWLLIRGVNGEQWKKRAAESADRARADDW
jgi:cytochrome c biogenesis protein CcdA